MDLSSVQLFTAKEKSEIEEKYNNGSGMVFSLISESGDQGFPGKLLVEVLVSLVEPKGPQTTQPELNLGAVVIVYRAKLLDEAVVTPINLTQHWGFNLDASLKDEIPDSLSVKEHALTIKSDHTIELDASGLSTGELLPVKGTHHAHAEKASGKIGENWPESGYGMYSSSLRKISPINDLYRSFLRIQQTTSRLPANSYLYLISLRNYLIRRRAPYQGRSTNRPRRRHCK